MGASVRRPLMRIPYTDAFVAPRIIPSSAKTLHGAVAALSKFFTSPPPPGLSGSTVVLTGAGLSVASGLADYRGENGTYRLNRTYRPIYYHEFLSSHEARKRYWARSFLGWTTLHNAKPNAGHYALRDLGQLGIVDTVITQNVDSFHSRAHPRIPTLELHGYLRSTICTSCQNEFPRDTFQGELARLNPAWAVFLVDVVASGALKTEDAAERRARGIRTNPDGDVDLPDAPYTTFRYPACTHCLAHPPLEPGGTRSTVEVDNEGAWKPTSTAGILKPAVVMFGESIAGKLKLATEAAIDQAGRLLVIGTSLATYSAWRIARRAKDRGVPIAIVNMGGVRGEDSFFAEMDPQQDGTQGLRVEMLSESLLPAVVDGLRQTLPKDGSLQGGSPVRRQGNAAAFKDLLS